MADLHPSRVAALYDIHGNLPALEAALQAVRHANVDLIVVGGDVLPGPMPRDTLACLRDLNIPALYIKGNGDREVLALRQGTAPVTVPELYRPAMERVAAELTEHDVRWIEARATRFPGAEEFAAKNMLRPRLAKHRCWRFSSGPH